MFNEALVEVNSKKVVPIVFTQHCRPENCWKNLTDFVFLLT